MLTSDHRAGGRPSVSVDEGAEVEGPDTDYWFTGRETVLLYYRVNRRPRSQQPLEAIEWESALVHLDTVLDPDVSVTSGRRYQRQWHLGQLFLDADRNVLTGQIGFEFEPTRTEGSYDEKNRAFQQSRVMVRDTAYAPFVFDGESRVLSILRHAAFKETTLARVFGEFLNIGEDRLRAPAYEWAVEPLLDRQSFYGWVERTAVVASVRFVAELPNPDAIEGFEWVDERMNEIEARRIEERLEARDLQVGLQRLDSDSAALAYTEYAERGFGYVAASGETEEGKVTRYDQRQQVAREVVELHEDSWPAIIERLIGLVRERWKGRL